MILAGDIGGTHTRLALFDQAGELDLVTEKKYRSRDHQSLAEIVRIFLAEKKTEITAACFGVAGAVRSGRCQATNLPWIIDERQLEHELNISRVRLLNDLEANAYGIGALKENELFVLCAGQKQTGNQALIAAGTGLGEAGLYWDGKVHHPFACEGGHADFAPRNGLEIELFQYLKKKWHHVSFERVVSGPGIYAIYRFLVESGHEKASNQVEAELVRGDAPRIISEYGRENRDSACSRALDLFLNCYGAEAGNLALKFLSLGGVYIGGGIAPTLLERIKKGGFYSAFVDKGRFTELLHSIPIYVILNDNAALLGAATFARGL